MALVCLLIVAAFTDIRERIISNWLNAAVALLAPVFWLGMGLSFWPDIAVQIGLAVLVFAVFTAAFAIGLMGGGDVKLITALALWLPWQALIMLILLMSLIGGAVALVTALHHRIARREGPPEVPYGVAISLAALWVIGEPYINQFVG